MAGSSRRITPSSLILFESPGRLSEGKPAVLGEACALLPDNIADYNPLASSPSTWRLGSKRLVFALSFLDA